MVVLATTEGKGKGMEERRLEDWIGGEAGGVREFWEGEWVVRD